MDKIKICFICIYIFSMAQYNPVINACYIGFSRNGYYGFFRTVARGRKVYNHISSIISNLLTSKEDKEDAQTKIFFLLIGETLENTNPEFLAEEIKNGNIKIYPERFSINVLIKVMPEEIIAKIIENLI